MLTLLEYSYTGHTNLASNLVVDQRDTLALAEELGFLLNLPLVRASLTVTDCLVQEVCV